MTIMTITLDDATELIEQDWFAFMSQRPIPLGIRNISLGDARDAGALFNQVGVEAEPAETEPQRRARLLDEVLGRFRREGIGVDTSQILTREEMYDRNAAR